MCATIAQGSVAMKALLAATILLASAVAADAKCDNIGNCYTGSGGATYGTSATTGSNWSSHSNSSGTTGVDSRGNSWSYGRGSGVY